jgi:glycosyltransferase involved in cell wall biosynthesis
MADEEAAEDAGVRTSNGFNAEGAEVALRSRRNVVANVSVIIPVLNEAGSIGDVVASMPWSDIAECIVVDNGSTDGSGEIAAAAGARVIQSPRGYGAAMHAGSEAALATSDILVYMDGDGQDAVEEMARVVGPIAKDEADFVITSRILGKRESGSMQFSQVMAGFVVGWLTRVFYKFHYTDMAAFRAIRRSSLEQMHMEEMTYGWNLEMQLKAIQLRLRILEVPAHYRRRAGGESKVSGNVRASWETVKRIFIVFRRVRRKFRKVGQ